MDKNILIEAIRQKGLSNSLISIYYNIGRALPFRAQRFPDGRVSDWYHNQFYEVHSVKPSGKGGQYGTAYGFLFRNGERVDDNVEPEEINCGACGSWMLLDILGEPTTETTKVYGLNDVLEKGKHQGKTVAEVIKTDAQWIRWANGHSQHFHFNVQEVFAEIEKNTKVLNPDDVMPFGKYKGKTIQEVADVDYDYLRWLADKSEDVRINFSEINLDKHFESLEEKRNNFLKGVWGENSK